MLSRRCIFYVDFILNIHILIRHMGINTAKFSIGDVVKHKHFNFRGVIYDVDFEFNNSEEWYESIPKDAARSAYSSG